jgi:hypothetical protein
LAQVFPRWSNVVSKATLIGAIAALAVLLWTCMVYSTSSFGTRQGVMKVQPIPFSHQHHAGILGIDCRYCHTTVEHSAFAGLPPTSTCMNCHSQIWVGSEMLAPVRESYRLNKPLHWTRIYNTPGCVYFDHSIHVQKGIGCASCHGQIDQMPFTFQAPSLLMEWCLDCHRHPERALRPRAEVFNMHYEPPEDQIALGRRLMEEYDIPDAHFLTSCSVCHR